MAPNSWAIISAVSQELRRAQIVCDLHITIQSQITRQVAPSLYDPVWCRMLVDSCCLTIWLGVIRVQAEEDIDEQ